MQTIAEAWFSSHEEKEKKNAVLGKGIWFLPRCLGAVGGIFHLSICTIFFTFDYECIS